MKQKLPAYPLFIKDPFFSMYADSTDLPTADTMFWTTAKRNLFGFLRVDEKAYSFMGQSETPRLKQVDVKITTFKTIYIFEQDDFKFTVEFVSPLPLDNLDMLACPTCYMNYKFESKNEHQIKVHFAMNEDWCYNLESKIAINGMKGRNFRLKDYQVSLMGANRQLFLSQADDEVLADWGYFLLAGQETHYADYHSLWCLKTGREIDAYHLHEDNKVLIVGSNKKEDFFVIARDEGPALQYFNEFLPNYYMRDNKTIMNAIEETIKNHAQIEEHLAKFDRKLKRMCNAVSKDYYDVCVAAYRQSIGAHKLAQTKDGELIFISKECGSNGCAATVDVAAPSIPLYLLFNPKLVRAMIKPVFDFARMPVWKYDFAPHDVGTYPLINGQVYGLGTFDEEVSCFEGRHDKLTTRLNHYTYPAEMDTYDFRFQMPVEESANMILMVYGVYFYGKDKKLIDAQFDLLKKWAVYLEKYGYMPGNQLCTDDFAGHLDKNVNLSVKATLALKSFIEMCHLEKEEELAKHYEAVLKTFVEHLEEVSKQNGYIPLTFEENDKRFSMKYNLVFDKAFGFNLFSKELYEREEAIYKKNTNKLGLLLDSRHTYTKADWEMWTAAFMSNEYRNQLITSLKTFLATSKTKFPFSDWYDCETSEALYFKNRTVIGGIFFPLLINK